MQSTLCSLNWYVHFSESISKAIVLNQHWLLVAHGAQSVALPRAPHPDDEVPAEARGDGQGPMHLLPPVKEALGHTVLHLRTLRLAQWHLRHWGKMDYNMLLGTH